MFKWLRDWWQNLLTRQQKREEQMIVEVLRTQTWAVDFPFLYRRLHLPRQRLLDRLTQLEAQGRIIRTPVEREVCPNRMGYVPAWRVAS
jgi:hypothetical protein